MCHCVRSRNLKNEAALASLGLLCHRKKKKMKNKTFSAENQFLFKIFISPPTSTVLPRAAAQLFPLL
jgi:hypothetical protein